MNHQKLMRRLWALTLTLAACAPTENTARKQAANNNPTAGLPKASCVVNDTTPALIETEIVRKLVTPAVLNDDGSVATPAVYRSEASPRIVEKRQTIEIATPCGFENDPQFVATLQRALKARGHYRGAISAEMDAETRKAIRAYQATDGLNSNVLSVDSAMELGLLAR